VIIECLIIGPTTDLGEQPGNRDGNLDFFNGCGLIFSDQSDFKLALSDSAGIIVDVNMSSVFFFTHIRGTR